MTELLTPHQAAERLQISERTLMEHVKAQDLDAIHIGRGRVRRRLRFDPADLEAFKRTPQGRGARIDRGTATVSVFKHAKTPFYHYDFQHKGRQFHGSTGRNYARGSKASRGRGAPEGDRREAIEARDNRRRQATKPPADARRGRRAILGSGRRSPGALRSGALVAQLAHRLFRRRQAHHRDRRRRDLPNGRQAPRREGRQRRGRARPQDDAKAEDASASRSRRFRRPASTAA